MRLSNLWLFIITILFSFPSFGQNILKGKIVNYKEEPVANTIIYLDSIKTNVVSNDSGYFRVKVPKGVSKITLYSSKYGFLSSAYDGETKVKFIFLEPIEEKENTKVLIGYGTEKKENLTASAGALNVRDDKNAFVFNSIYDYIRGRVAGVKVTDSNEIFIRGLSSFNLSNAALLVVDGMVVNNIDNISPVDVDYISVLKGPDASIYGSRGANGVVEITTKQQ